MIKQLTQTLAGFFLLLAGSFNASAQVKITDTIFYGSDWKICEEEIASYYRVGSLMAIDTVWYYTGKVKDYTKNHNLIMEGEYSNAGLKKGVFKFYFRDGSLMASGSYHNNNMFGIWQWFYTNGKEKAAIYFSGDEQAFQFIRFADTSGKLTMENGVGDFEWRTIPMDAWYSHYKVTGSFNSGIRTGTWNYNYWLNYEGMNFKEEYLPDGKLKKVTGLKYANTPRPKEPYQFRFSPEKFWITESIAYHSFFTINGDSLTNTALLNCLIDRKPPGIISKFKNFDTAYYFMLETLNRFSMGIEYRDKMVEAKIEFRIGDNNYPEDISISGNLTKFEEGLLLFVMKKFRNIDMPTAGSVAIEKFHTIHVFSIDLRDYLPGELRQSNNIDLFFSHRNKKETIAHLDANKKQFKKFVRKQVLGY